MACIGMYKKVSLGDKEIETEEEIEFESDEALLLFLFKAESSKSDDLFELYKVEND